MDDQTWAERLPAAITVTAADGTITGMNARACQTFAADGGADLVGRSLFDCHPGASREKTETLFRHQQPNHYTIRKNGQKKIIHQLPYFDADGAFAGFVEISIPIPDDLPHFDRG